MSKLPIPPELEEYTKENEWKNEHYPKSKDMKKYEELELEFIKNLYLEKYKREPTEEEIEDQRIELMKMKYLIELWMDEYLEKVKKEHEAEQQARKGK